MSTSMSPRNLFWWGLKPVQPVLEASSGKQYYLHCIHPEEGPSFFPLAEKMDIDFVFHQIFLITVISSRPSWKRRILGYKTSVIHVAMQQHQHGLSWIPWAVLAVGDVLRVLLALHVKPQQLQWLKLTSTNSIIAPGR